MHRSFQAVRSCSGHPPIIPSGSVSIGLVLVIPTLFRFVLGLAPIILGGAVVLRLVLIIPDLFKVLFGLRTYHF